MTSAFIETSARVSLNGFDYNIKGEVRSSSASRYAGKIVIGPTDINAHEDVSYLRWDDWSEGIGLREFYSAGGIAPKRVWFSDCDLSNPGHTTLGSLVTKTAAIEGTFPTAAAPGDDLPTVVIFKSEVYAMVRNTVATVDLIRVYKYNNGTDSWGSAVHTLPAGAITFSMNADMVVGFVGGVDNIIVCAGSHYSFSTDGASWTDSTKDVMRMTIHDDSLWGIDRTGQLWLATTLGTEVNKAQLPVPSTAATTDIAYISDLVTVPDASREFAIHAATAFGLYIYDQTNDRWIRSNIVFPEARYNGRGTNVWNADLYVPAGMGLWRVIYGTETQVFPIGPDRDHGLPAIHRGAIVDLAPGHDMVAVCLEGDFPGFRNFVTTATDLRSLVMSYDGRGWQVLWQSTTANERARKLIIGSAYDSYRLWFTATVTTADRNIYYIDLSSERVEPHEAQSRNYASVSTLETPIFNVGQDVEGVALAILVEPHDTTTSETVEVEYRIDSGNYVSVGTISGDAPFEFLLPSASDVSGLVFQTIQFQLSFARDSTITNRPFMHSLTFKFLKVIPDRQTHILTLDLSEEVGGQSPREQYRNLRAALRKRDLLEFTFRDDPALGSEDRFFVRIKNFHAEMDTGLDYKGQVSLELVEVQHIVGGSWDIDNWDEFVYA